ncbi:hypothetical protein [Trinickia fusca]|uniref:hypothetical protein n=1 Tax=Trinickia fusca TaxID=2419777 RepID=UPI001601F920|nr:hypothetical protein [Trinickia fusca]
MMKTPPQHAPVLRAAVFPSDCGMTKGIACGAAVAAVGVGCAVSGGLACLPALRIVANAGCCDCLMNGTLVEACKAIF